MLGRLTSLFGGGSANGGPPAPSSLPRELLLAIETAQILWRPSRADDEEAGPIVMVVGVGRWVWDGVEDAAARVAKSYPELPGAHHTRAAKLIRGQIGRRNRQAFGKRGKRGDPIDRALAREHDYFGGIFRD